MRQPFYWIKTITPTGLKKEYARILPDIRQAARKRGYAIGVHGSMMRDLDLIAVPWKSRTSSHSALIKAIQLAVSHCYEKEPTIIKRPHGRIAYILKVGRKAYIDLSVMPANRDKAHNTMGIALSSDRQAEPLVRRQFELREGYTITARGERWKAKIVDWNVSSNRIQMVIESEQGDKWTEDWNYQHTLVGLKRGDYKLSA